MAIDLAHFMTHDDVLAMRAENARLLKEVAHLKGQLVEIDAVLERDGKLTRLVDGKTLKRFVAERTIGADEIRYDSSEEGVVKHISGVLCRRVASDLANEIRVERIHLAGDYGQPSIHLRASIGVVP